MRPYLENSQAECFSCNDPLVQAALFAQDSVKLHAQGMVRVLAKKHDSKLVSRPTEAGASSCGSSRPLQKTTCPMDTLRMTQSTCNALAEVYNSP